MVAIEKHFRFTTQELKQEIWQDTQKVLLGELEHSRVRQFR